MNSPSRSDFNLAVCRYIRVSPPRFELKIGDLGGSFRSQVVNFVNIFLKYLSISQLVLNDDDFLSHNALILI